MDVKIDPKIDEMGCKIEEKWMQNRTKINGKLDPKIEENEYQKPPKWKPEASQIEPRGRQEGARTPQKQKKKIDPTKNIPNK